MCGVLIKLLCVIFLRLKLLCKLDDGSCRYGFSLAIDQDILVFIADIDVDDSLGVLKVGIPVHR